MDRRCRESEGKAKIEGYMSVSDEEAHHRIFEIMHDLNRDIAGSDSRAFRSLLDQGSKRDGVWAL